MLKCSSLHIRTDRQVVQWNQVLAQHIVFVDKLLNYQNKTKQNKKIDMLKCEISQNKYPAKHAIAGHIFKKSFRSTKLRHLLNLSDINDPGNSILM